MVQQLKMYLPMNQRLLDLSIFSLSKELIDKYYEENSVECEQYPFPETYKSINKLVDRYYESINEPKLSYEEKCFLFARLYSIKGFTKAVSELGKLINCQFALKVVTEDECKLIPYGDADLDNESQLVVEVKTLDVSYDFLVYCKNYILDAIKDLLWYVDQKCYLSFSNVNLRLDFTTRNDISIDMKMISQNEAKISRIVSEA